MHDYIVATWGAWDEQRVQRESNEDSASPNAQVIQVGHVPAGVLLVDREATHLQVQQIYLLPEFQRQGIGLLIMNGLLSEALKLKIPVRLRVLAVNPAKAFYEKLGFVVTESTSDFIYMERSP